MNKKSLLNTPRRQALRGLAAVGVAVTGAFVPTRFAIGAPAKLKIGFMLPYSGTYAALGNNITDAFKMRVAELGNKLAGREIDYILLDDESAPPKAKDNAAKLILREKVDVLIGSVHSGVAMAMAQVARDEGTLTICPNAGADDLTRSMCAFNIFRSSFSSWQCGYPAGTVVLKDGFKKVVTITWNYPGGKENVQGFRDSFLAGGGQIVKDILLDFPSVEFQAHLTEIAAIKPDAVFTFFAGGGALKFINDYAAAGLQGKIPLYGVGFLTDGVYQKAGNAANGIKTTLHYSDALDTPKNKAFRTNFESRVKRAADVYAVQGYDAAEMLRIGLEAAKGDVGAQPTIVAALENATIESARGDFTLSKAHNPVQDIYLREIVNGMEKVLGVAHKALADPGTNCKITW
ncbi:MAG: ABC transporter substrate-binding protein [Burkholderiaceae bacterium]|nr:ABC transporter substrate-binding protein [Burkholderiaceae bacterium]